MTDAFAGTKQLLQTTLKHDGRNYAPWIAFATFLSVTSVIVYPWLFPDARDRAMFAGAIGSNPAMGLIFGPAFDLSTTDGFNAWRALALGGFTSALGAILVVTQATRGQEDSGQAELLASGALGRGSRLLVGAGFAAIGSVMVAIFAWLTTILFGGDVWATLLLAATFTASGWMFAGVAAIAAQLGSDARTSNSIAVGTLGALFLLRGLSYSLDVPDWTVWVNPLGWMTETRPATGDHWWPLILAVVFAIVAFGIGYALQSHRDFGQGAIAPRPGPANGNIRSPWRLALRLNAGSMITWTVAFVFVGAAFGSFATSIEDFIGEGSPIAAVLESGMVSPDALTSAFLVTILTMVGIIAAVPGVQTMLKVRSEEIEDRVEPIIATATHRINYYGSNIALAFLTSAGGVLIAGTIIATIATGADIGVHFGDAMLQVLTVIPAVWAVVAVSVMVVGARPVLMLAAWAGIIGSFGLTFLGPSFKLPDWALGISPFWHIPYVTDDNATWMGLVWVAIAGAILVVIGCVGFGHRDLAK